ncbi:MAG: restriction endonuclease [Haemophilus parainfluenzae]|jgi:hypothetical protein|nr:restriction endonuclease [Haemophilus parainfluenzae]
MFEKIKPTNIRFIKLGVNGCWEEKSITEEHVIRLGYEFKPETNMHEECLNDRWDKCREYCIEHWSKNSGAVTRHVNQIRDFYTLDENTLWITFYGRKLYWAFCDSTVHLDEDQTRWRKVKSNGGTWSCLDRNGKELTIDNLDGRVTKVQAYRGTICGVEMEDYLIRRINGEVIEEITEAENSYDTLINSVEKLIKGLWWSDFELLTDLVFSKLGWQRYSVLGKTEKGIDLDLYSPSTQKRVFVQIKSYTDRKQLDEYVSKFQSEYKNYGYSEMYYVYHSGLENIDEKQYQDKEVKLINSRKMAELVISAGLVKWLIKKRS